MATSKFSSVQVAVKTCINHDQEETDMYCKTCKTPVCVTCVKDEHRSHEWDTMKNVAKFLRAHTKQRKLEMESAYNSILIGVTESLDSISSRVEYEFSTNCCTLESTRKKLIGYVNSRIDEMKTKCEKNHKTKKGKFETKKDKLKENESRVKFLIQEMETGATNFTDFDLIELHDELQHLLSEIQSLAEIPSDFHDRFVYIPGSSDLSIIFSLLGSVEEKRSSERVVFKHQFKYNDEIIDHICPVSDNEAWIHASGSKEYKLTDSEGNIKKSEEVMSVVGTVAMRRDGTMIFCDSETKSIKGKDDEGNIKELFSTAPFHPTCVNLTRSGDLLVPLVGKEKPQERGISHVFQVRRLTTTGGQINKYVLDTEEKMHSPFPWRVVENYNGDVCILVWCLDTDSVPEFSVIYCIDCKGLIVFKFGGKEANFAVTDICCDLNMNILATDSKHKRIHVIDAKGIFLRYLLDEKSFNKHPGVISLLGNTLWVGIDDAPLIQVYKYEY